ncbi:MAG: lysophospholipid acyltransferase family protein [Myxococcales bacterium]
MLYEFLRHFIGACLEMFYRRTDLGGRIPDEGPVVIVANHPNGLVDPMLLGHITPRQVRFLAKAPLFQMPIVGAIMKSVGALPVYRVQDSPGEQDKNEQTFSACYDALAQKSAIAIFPEGVSHSVPHLQRMKTGAARIALGAEARSGWTLGVRIVPVGLTYRNKHRFRGQVATEVGEPIDVRDVKELYEKDPREASEELTRRIGERIAKLTVNVEKWEDLPAVEAAEMIYAREKGLSLKSEDRQRRVRLFAEGLRLMREHDPDRVERLRDQIASFSERLHRIGANPADLDARYSPSVVFKYFVRNLAALLFGLPLATLGVVCFYLPYQIPRLVISLKDPPLDIVASVKIGVILVVFPLWYALVVALFGLTVGWEGAVLAAIAMPVCGWYAIQFLERREEALEDAAIFLRLGLRRARKQRLLERRAMLARQIDELITARDALLAADGREYAGGAAPPSEHATQRV